MSTHLIKQFETACAYIQGTPSPEEIKKHIESSNIGSIHFEDFISSKKLENRYDRILLFENTISCFLMVWPAQSASAIHEHKNFWGFISLLSGSLIEKSFSYENQKLTLLEEQALEKRVLVEETENAIHQILNPHDEIAVTLNMYYPAQKNLDGTLLFDIEKKRMGVLNSFSQSCSWNEPGYCFSSITENAFSVY